mmetsp:Transcript_16361/g.39547  ORF Transcript_16361/g.39547 Transcript_16361/m.39547 type:complete len:241 (+) Transcript_16361:3187-3909(+)
MQCSARFFAAWSMFVSPTILLGIHPKRFAMDGVRSSRSKGAQCLCHSFARPSAAARRTDSFLSRTRPPTCSRKARGTASAWCRQMSTPEMIACLRTPSSPSMMRRMKGASRSSPATMYDSWMKPGASSGRLRIRWCITEIIALRTSTSLSPVRRLNSANTWPKSERKVPTEKIAPRSLMALMRRSGSSTVRSSVYAGSTCVSTRGAHVQSSKTASSSLSAFDSSLSIRNPALTWCSWRST